MYNSALAAETSLEIAIILCDLHKEMHYGANQNPETFRHGEIDWSHNRLRELFPFWSINQTIKILKKMRILGYFKIFKVREDEIRLIFTEKMNEVFKEYMK